MPVPTHRTGPATYRLVTPRYGQQSPRSTGNDLLGDGERCLLTTGLHWISLARNLVRMPLWSLGLLTAAIVGIWIIPGLVTQLTVVGLSTAHATRIGVHVLSWRRTVVIVTNLRILLSSGIIARSVEVVQLTKVTDLIFSRSIAGRVLGYGKLHVKTAGQPVRDIDYLPAIEAIYRATLRPSTG